MSGKEKIKMYASYTFLPPKVIKHYKKRKLSDIYNPIIILFAFFIVFF